MLIKSIRIGFVVLVLSVASAWAEPSTIVGVVKDAKGQPIRGADIRITARNDERFIRTVKTDLNGRYTSGGLPAGTYRTTLVVDGAVKTSINNTKVALGEPTRLNFDLITTSGWRASLPPGKGKHWVWIPPFTASRLPGRWVEVDDSGSRASVLNGVRISGEELRRTGQTFQRGVDTAQ